VYCHVVIPENAVFWNLSGIDVANLLRDELEVDSRLRGNDNVCFKKFNLLKNFKYFILIKTPFLPCDKLLL